jgi:hypothetical protein
MVRKLSAIYILMNGLWLGGCASIVNGTNQSVSLDTPNARGATCTLENGKGKWYVNQTPASVTVNRSYSDLKIACNKKGYYSGLKTVPSQTKGMAFGNVIFGGIIGAGVDVADGAAYDYPTDIVINMEKKALA